MKLMAMLLFAGSLCAQSGDFDRARQLLASGRAAEAARIFRELIKVQPSSAEMHLNLSIAEFKAGEFQSAAESAKAVVRLAPELAAGHLFFGAAELELGDFTAALPALERAVALNPQDRNAGMMLGDAYAGAGRLKEALGQYEAALRRSPANARLLYGIARTCEALGDKTRARENWMKLLELPPSPELHIHLAEESVADSRWLAAAEQWREALRLSPENRKARIGLSWALFRSRDYEGVLAALKPLLNGSAGADVLFLNGAALMNMQSPEQAIPVLYATIAKAPNMPEARAALGQALLQTGKPAEATAHLLAGLAADHDGTTHFQLFRAYQLTGRKQEAQRALADYQRVRALLTKATESTTAR